VTEEMERGEKGGQRAVGGYLERCFRIWIYVGAAAEFDGSKPILMNETDLFSGRRGVILAYDCARYQSRREGGSQVCDNPQLAVTVVPGSSVGYASACQPRAASRARRLRAS